MGKGVYETPNRHQRVVTLHGTLFDLAELEKHTKPDKTERVNVLADIVHMTKPLFINYDLTIRARKVYINEALTMDMSMTEFKSKQKYHVVHSKQIRFTPKNAGAEHRSTPFVQSLSC